ncbi:DUF4178 domain-containing protein [Epibacterium ulvae]|nr:DUF4178 domain-containing protein [Epibacterium ulvae]
MHDFQCPNCGSSVAPAFQTVKMVTCSSCGTSLFLSDQAAEQAGEQGAMHDVPMLFGLGSHLRMGRDTYNIVGHARFSYGRGTWDEFCALNSAGAPLWISVDEGDIILQEEVRRAKWPRYDGYLKLGKVISYDGGGYRVVEDGKGECIALRGSFDEPLYVGEIYRYVNLQGENGDLLSAEIDGDQYAWFVGRWFDPFEVEVLS